MYKVLLISFCITLIFSCKQSETPYYKFSGPTMGTKYHITAQTEFPEALQVSVDSILDDFNFSMSAYIDNSTLSYFNNADSIYCFDTSKDPYFEPIFNKAQEVYKNTGGAFDPSITPLVNYYGFGYKEKKQLSSVDTATVLELLKLLVFDSLSLEKMNNGQICIHKPNKDVKLDFNSLSPGYAADVIGAFFVSKNIRNYMIDIGGEFTAHGVNDRKEDWVIGINKPKEGVEETEIELPLRISNKALATSGNYRSSYESKGQKFAHTINPFTGMSQPTDILSATVIADDCISADAYATAFMVLGLEKSLALVKQLKGIDACFIYDNEGDGIFEFKVSEGFSMYYLHNEQN